MIKGYLYTKFNIYNLFIIIYIVYIPVDDYIL